jgi:Bacterial regulatory proteins, luxR family
MLAFGALGFYEILVRNLAYPDARHTPLAVLAMTIGLGGLAVLGETLGGANGCFGASYQGRRYGAGSRLSGRTDRPRDRRAQARRRRLSDAEVGEQLFVSVRTVNAHLRSIYRKAGVRSRAAASRFAEEHGLL